MQTRPANWASLVTQPHITQYRYLIDGEQYSGEFIQGTPTIEKPMMLEPVIGRCCTGSLSITVRKKTTAEIPKAAAVQVDCRLSSYDGRTTTSWIPQGRFWVAKRTGFGDLVSLTCRDSMMFAGKSYTDKKHISTWPASMSTVLMDIASIMGVQIDPRTTIGSGAEYMVSLPESDVLMSEILSLIAATHGGNFIITEAGKLRLVPFPAEGTPVFALQQAYRSYTPYSVAGNTISRLILKNKAGNQYTVGDDTGVWLTGECATATQAMADRISGSAYTYANGTFSIPTGELQDGTAVVVDPALSLDNGVLRSLSNTLLGRNFTPYRLEGAYMDPSLELGDTFSAVYRGETLTLIANSITVSCTTGYTCSIENGVMHDDEEEVVYTTPKELNEQRTAARAVRNSANIAAEKTRAEEAESNLSTRIIKESNRIGLVVTEKNGKNEINTAQIILSINQSNNGTSTSQAEISADKINLTGYVTASQLDTRLLNVDNLFANSGYAGSIKAGTVTTNKITLPGYQSEVEGSDHYGLSTDFTAHYISMIRNSPSTVGAQFLSNGDVNLSHAHAVTLDSTTGVLTLGDAVTVGSASANFNIADTTWYKTQVASAETAARNSIEISGYSWSVTSADNTQAAHGKTYSVKLTNVTLGYRVGEDSEHNPIYSDPTKTYTQIGPQSITEVYNAGWEAGNTDGIGTGQAAGRNSVEIGTVIMNAPQSNTDATQAHGKYYSITGTAQLNYQSGVDGSGNPVYTDIGLPKGLGGPYNITGVYNDGWTDGQNSVTVTDASLVVNSLVYDPDERTAAGSVDVRLSNMDANDPPIRLTGIDFSEAYKAGLDGEEEVNYQDYEFILQDNGTFLNTDEYTLDVSAVYQQGVDDATPAEYKFYIYSDTGDLVDVYSTFSISGGQFHPGGTLIGSLYPNTDVTRLSIASWSGRTYGYDIRYEGKHGYIPAENLVYTNQRRPSPTNYPGKIGWYEPATLTNVTVSHAWHYKADNESAVSIYLDVTKSGGTEQSSVWVSASDYASIATTQGEYAYNYLDVLSNGYYAAHSQSVGISEITHKVELTLWYSDNTTKTVVVELMSRSKAPEVQSITLQSLIHNRADYSEDILVSVDPDNESAKSVWSIAKYSSEYTSTAVTPGEDVSDYLDIVYNSCYGSHSSRFLNGRLGHKATFLITYDVGEPTTVTVLFESAAKTPAMQSTTLTWVRHLSGDYSGGIDVDIVPQPQVDTPSGKTGSAAVSQSTYDSKSVTDPNPGKYLMLLDGSNYATHSKNKYRSDLTHRACFTELYDDGYSEEHIIEFDSHAVEAKITSLRIDHIYHPNQFSTSDAAISGLYAYGKTITGTMTSENMDNQQYGSIAATDDADEYFDTISGSGGTAIYGYHYISNKSTGNSPHMMYMRVFYDDNTYKDVIVGINTMPEAKEWTLQSIGISNLRHSYASYFDPLPVRIGLKYNGAFIETRTVDSEAVTGYKPTGSEDVNGTYIGSAAHSQSKVQSYILHGVTLTYNLKSQYDNDTKQETYNIAFRSNPTLA